MGNPKTTRAIWNRANIESLKSEVRDELNLEGMLPKDRLERAFDCIQDLADDLSPQGQLKRFIFALSVLAHHLRHGGLARSQIKNLATLAEAILKIQGVKPNKSKLAFLYGDLHLILSQISWREGRQWDAAWEQDYARHVSASTASGGDGIPSLGAGVRAMRLGHGFSAVQLFNEAESKGLEAHFLVRNRLYAVQALRLSGRLTEATTLLVNTERELQVDQAEKMELEWERKCQEVQRTGKVGPLINAVVARGSHHFPIYALETFLWSRIVKNRQWIQKYPSFRRLVRDPQMDPKPIGLFYQCVKTFEILYDPQTPFLIRLKKLGELLNRVNKLGSLDKELLVWAAATRWLSRNGSSNTLSLVRGEYQGISLRLSDGKFHDCLGLLGDVVEAPFELKKAS